jgi:signal transduction histidine kinase/ActR/RegA family two-component response regulator
VNNGPALRSKVTRTIAVTAALGIAATTLAYVVVRNDVDRLNRRRVDRPATESLLGVQQLSASVDQVLATANGVVATSGVDPKRFVAVLGPDVRASETLAGMALVADTSSGPRIVARVGDTHLLRSGRTALVPSASSTLVRSRREGDAYDLGFAALVAHGRRAVYLQVTLPVEATGVPFAIVDPSYRVVLGNVRDVRGLTPWNQPVSFAGRSYTLLVRPGAAPGAVLGLSLPLLLVVVGLLLTAIAMAVAAAIVRRNATVRHLDVENRALDDALARQLAIEAELRGWQGRFRTILRGTPDVIFLFDPHDGSCEVLNRTDLFGHAIEAVSAAGGLASLVDPDDRVIADAHWERIAELDDDRVTETTLRLRDAEGEVRIARMRFAPLRAVDPQLGGCLIGVLSDVTEARTVETQQAELQDALLRAQRLDAIGQLAGGVAHDFNNLLATILASAELLDDYVSEGRPREYVGEIERAATRGAALVRQLLTFAQRDHAEPQLVDLNAIVTGIEPLLRRTLGDHIQLQITTTDCSAEVVGDPTHVEQIILNLAVNARDAMPDGGVLWIATAIDFDDERPENDRVVLSVIDTGGGIPPEVRDRMFEPFVTTKEPGKGTGLGLATVRSIVNEMQGEIKVLTKVGEGTTFEVSMARRFGDVAAVTAEDRPEVLEGAGRHILLVEDDTAVRFALAHLLRRLDFNVTTSTHGSEALQFIEQQRYDLVLTDAVMPGLSGPELIRNLQHLRPELPVIMMSGYTSEALPEGAAAAGVQQLRKPFTNAELTRALGRAFEDPVPEQAPT